MSIGLRCFTSTTLCLLLSLYPILCNSECPGGWQQNNGYCYYFSEINNTRSMKDAAHECYIRDAQLARPESAAELEFLKSLTSSSNAYGWLLNIIDIPKYKYYDILKDNNIPFVPVEGSLPTFVPKHDPAGDFTDQCIAFHDTDFWYSSSPSWFEAVSCQVILHVACHANSSKFRDQEIDQKSWFKSKSYLSDVFWVSDQLATFTEAKQMCKDKGMNLMDNVDLHSDHFFVAIDMPPDAVPFWSGLTFGTNGIERENGDVIKDSDIKWEEWKYPSSSAVLLHSGYAQSFDLTLKWDSAFPFICKKLESGGGQFDCPSLWVRAGRSCYSAAFASAVTWNRAQEICQMQDSHLLKIDSLDEIFWLDVIFAPYIYLNSHGLNKPRHVWTGASDLLTEGNFTWEDGTAVSQNFFPWLTDTLSNMEEKRCAYLRLQSEEIHPTSCSDRKSIACQYDLESSESGCVTDWKEFEGTCYFVAESYHTGLHTFTFELNTPVCLSKLEGSNVQSSRVKMLQAQSKSVLDFLKNTFVYNNNPVWLGLEARVQHGQFLWLDGTVEENMYLILSKYSDPTQHCVAADMKFKAIKISCDTELVYVCEKELPQVDARFTSSGSRLHTAASIVTLLLLLFILL